MMVSRRQKRKAELAMEFTDSKKLPEVLEPNFTPQSCLLDKPLFLLLC